MKKILISKWKGSVNENTATREQLVDEIYECHEFIDRMWKLLDDAEIKCTCIEDGVEKLINEYNNRIIPEVAS